MDFQRSQLSNLYAAETESLFHAVTSNQAFAEVHLCDPSIQSGNVKQTVYPVREINSVRKRYSIENFVL